MSSFKERQSFSKREQEAKRIREKYIDRVPVIVECTDDAVRATTSKEKIKFLVPKELLVTQFIFVIRERMKLKPEQGIFLYVNGHLPNVVETMDHLDAKERDADGFLYVQYCFENTFGGGSSVFVSMLALFFLLSVVAVLVWYVSVTPTVYPASPASPASPARLSSRLLVIGGSHGNETGVSDAIARWDPTATGLSRYYRIDRMPYASPMACWWGCRTTYGVDVNRMYGRGDRVPWYVRPLIQTIEDHVLSSDVVIDFHEARREHRQTLWSMGNAVWPGQTAWSQSVATELVRRLNMVDPNQSWVVGRWSSTKWRGQATLRDYCDTKQIPYLLIEVTGQSEGPSQKKQQVVDIVLDYFQSTPGQAED